MVDPAYLPDNMDDLHVEVTDGIDSTTVFAGIVDAIEDTEEKRDQRVNPNWWYRLHSRPVLPD